MAIDYDTPDEQWPQKGRGGFMRNYNGQAVVSHPDGGKRTLIYEGASSLLEFANPYTGDPIHGDRGTHVHTLCDLADHGEPLSPEFIAAGEAIGISAELQNYVYARWIVFRKAHGLTAVAIEATVVNDDWKVATNIDRVDQCAMRVAGDIKTSADPVRLGYQVQLAAAVRSVPYDVDSGERGDWDEPFDQDVGHIYWFPIAKAINADRADWPDWTLITVQLADGHAIGNQLAAIKAAKVDKDTFTTIAAPTNPPPVVEQRAGGATHGSEAPPATFGEQLDALASHGGTLNADDHKMIVDTIRAHRDGGEPTPTLDELRATANAMSPADHQVIRDYLDGTKPADDVAKFAAAIDHAKSFHDVATEPVERPKAQPADRPAPKVIDEGADLDVATVDAAGKRYLELPDDTRSWVSVSGARVRLNPDSGGQATERRMELLRGLCALAEAGYDSDDMARAVIAHILGDEAWQGAPVADLVAALDIAEARRFAAMCDALAGRADVALHYELDGRAVLSPSVVGVAA